MHPRRQITYPNRPISAISNNGNRFSRHPTIITATTRHRRRAAHRRLVIGYAAYIVIDSIENLCHIRWRFDECRQCQLSTEYIAYAAEHRMTEIGDGCCWWWWCFDVVDPVVLAWFGEYESMYGWCQMVDGWMLITICNWFEWRNSFGCRYLDLQTCRHRDNAAIDMFSMLTPSIHNNPNQQSTPVSSSQSYCYY